MTATDWKLLMLGLVILYDTLLLIKSEWDKENKDK